MSGPCFSRSTPSTRSRARSSAPRRCCATARCPATRRPPSTASPPTRSPRAPWGGLPVRGAKRAPAFVCADISASKLAILDNARFRLLKHLWPGPYCFSSRPRASAGCSTRRSGTVGIRVPRGRAGAAGGGGPIVTTTAAPRGGCTSIRRARRKPPGGARARRRPRPARPHDDRHLSTSPPEVVREGKGDVSPSSPARPPAGADDPSPARRRVPGPCAADAFGVRGRGSSRRRCCRRRRRRARRAARRAWRRPRLTAGRAAAPGPRTPPRATPAPPAAPPPVTI